MRMLFIRILYVKWPHDVSIVILVDKEGWCDPTSEQLRSPTLHGYRLHVVGHVIVRVVCPSRLPTHIAPRWHDEGHSEDWLPTDQGALDAR